MATGLRLGAFCLVMWLVIAEISSKPTAADTMAGDALSLSSTAKPTVTGGQRMSRLQKPTSQVYTGFDEIVVESNLQVHRGGSKSKSKITLPTSANSSTAASSAQNGGGNKSARSLEV